jgi:hypothetical protein
MTNKLKKRITPEAFKIGFGIGVSGWFQRKIGRQALVLIEYLLGNDNSASFNELVHRFTCRDGFASDSTVRAEIERLLRKGIAAEEKDEYYRIIKLTPDFLHLCETFDLDVPEILQSYFDPTFIRCAPIFHGRMFRENIYHFAFVLMPFAEQFDDIYKDHIEPTVEKYIDFFDCMRADEIYEPNEIMESIWESLVTCEVVISDLTSKNPNVFYETGIAHTLGKPTILLSQTIDDVPFDLRHLNVILYDPSYRGCLKLRKDLTKALNVVLEKYKKSTPEEIDKEK